MYINPNLLPRQTDSTTIGPIAAPTSYSYTASSSSTAISSRIQTSGSVTNTRYLSYTSTRSSALRYTPSATTTLRSGSSSGSSLFGGNSGNGGLSGPLKFIIPIFAVFFAIVVISILVTVVRRTGLNSKFHRGSYPPPPMGYERTTSISNPYISNPSRPNAPFEIDSPTITPYPLPNNDHNTDTSGMMRQSALSNPVIQDLPSAYHFTPTARERTDAIDGSSNLPGYQRSDAGGTILPPTYEEVVRGSSR